MQDFPVCIEVVAICEGKTACKGRAKTPLGQAWEMHVHTPAGMCGRAFAMLYPYLLSMRFADEIFLERGCGYAEFVCPDGDVTFRVSRVISVKNGD